jgi:hypothetical protein
MRNVCIISFMLFARCQTDISRSGTDFCESSTMILREYMCHMESHCILVLVLKKCLHTLQKAGISVSLFHPPVQANKTRKATLDLIVAVHVID